MEILDILKTCFSSVWSLFTGVEIPGLGVSFGMFFLAIIAIKIALSILRAALGVGNGGTSYRAGSSRKAKISEDRKDDEY